MEQTRLNKELDRKATIENVRSFFKFSADTPSGFERLVASAGSSMSDLKSPLWSDMPKAHSVFNDQAEKRFDRRQELEACYNAIHAIPLKLRRLFIFYYLDNDYHEKQWTDVADWYGMSRKQTSSHMDKAMLYFADSFQGERDFHIYCSANHNQQHHD